MLLNYDTSTNFNPAHRQSDFDKEPGKVSKKFEFEHLSLSACRSQYWWVGCTVDTVSHEILNKEIEDFQKNLLNFFVQIDF